MIEISSGGGVETFPLNFNTLQTARTPRAVCRKCLESTALQTFLKNKYVRNLIFDKPSDNS